MVALCSAIFVLTCLMAFLIALLSSLICVRKCEVGFFLCICLSCRRELINSSMCGGSRGLCGFGVLCFGVELAMAVWRWWISSVVCEVMSVVVRMFLGGQICVSCVTLFVSVLRKVGQSVSLVLNVFSRLFVFVLRSLKSNVMGRWSDPMS